MEEDTVEEDTVAAAATSTSASDDWEVVVAELHDRGNAANGVETSVLVHGQEAEARRVYADAVAVAAERGVSPQKLVSELRALVPATAQVRTGAAQAAQDAQGRVQAMNTSFALHQLSHTHNLVVHGSLADPAFKKGTSFDKPRTA